MPKTSFEKLVHILRLYLEKQVTRMKKASVKLLLFRITSVTKPAIIRKQILLVYHVDRCHL